ncbi:hypothetical protein K8F61_09515 [Microbacterium resistens]|uniref:Uncharacterized protein n=1 Tax=Microbacterium resistens TaxID=156977 RepID=A0ABY3RZ61_9MICO|nr:hypothetical protein [Microbacterium resistens]UGS28365.1 hypothetical protein K8F61_09515 [Microbacterium resistens]
MAEPTTRSRNRNKTPAPVVIGFCILLISLILTAVGLIVAYIAMAGSGQDLSDTLTNRAIMSGVTTLVQFILLFMVLRGNSRARLAITVLQVASLIPVFLHPEPLAFASVGIGILAAILFWIPASKPHFTSKAN